MLSTFLVWLGTTLFGAFIGLAIGQLVIRAIDRRAQRRWLRQLERIRAAMDMERDAVFDDLERQVDELHRRRRALLSKEAN